MFTKMHFNALRSYGGAQTPRARAPCAARSGTVTLQEGNAPSAPDSTSNSCEVYTELYMTLCIVLLLQRKQCRVPEASRGALKQLCEY